MEVGERVSVGELTVTAVPARHDPRRGPFGQRAQPLGYLISTADRMVYFPGDTDPFPEMSDLGPLDVALMPVGDGVPTLGDGHMTPTEAALALRLLRPRLAVPIDSDTLYPVGLRRVRPRALSEPPLEFARQAQAIAPDVVVRSPEPG